MTSDTWQEYQTMFDHALEARTGPDVPDRECRGRRFLAATGLPSDLSLVARLTGWFRYLVRPQGWKAGREVFASRRRRMRLRAAGRWGAPRGSPGREHRSGAACRPGRRNRFTPRGGSGRRVWVTRGWLPRPRRTAHKRESLRRRRPRGSVAWVNGFKSFTTLRYFAGGRQTPIWQPSFFDRRITTDEDFTTVLRYIAQNPVEAGLASLPSEHPWLWLADPHTWAYA
jgi:hypothetical protein